MSKQFLRVRDREAKGPANKPRGAASALIPPQCHNFALE
jgi:hypothetical protein